MKDCHQDFDHPECATDEMLSCFELLDGPKWVLLDMRKECQRQSTGNDKKEKVETGVCQSMTVLEKRAEVLATVLEICIARALGVKFTSILTFGACWLQDDGLELLLDALPDLRELPTTHLAQHISHIGRDHPYKTGQEKVSHATREIKRLSKQLSTAKCGVLPFSSEIVWKHFHFQLPSKYGWELHESGKAQDIVHSTTVSQPGEVSLNDFKQVMSTESFAVQHSISSVGIPTSNSDLATEPAKQRTNRKRSNASQDGLTPTVTPKPSKKKQKIEPLGPRATKELPATRAKNDLPKADVSRFRLDQPRHISADESSYTCFMVEAPFPVGHKHHSTILCPWCGPEIEEPFVNPKLMTMHIRAHGMSGAEDVKKSLGIRNPQNRLMQQMRRG